MTTRCSWKTFKTEDFISRLRSSVLCTSRELCMDVDQFTTQYTHLEQNKLLPDVQSAYCHGHSTETAVLKVYSDIIDAIFNGKFALLSLFDLTAAFDMIDHEILMRHLEITFGFRCAILQWLGSYLEGRTQSILLNGQSTVARTVELQRASGIRARATALHSLYSEHWQTNSAIQS